MSNIDTASTVPNAKRLLLAGFMAILAAGIGFAIRGGIMDNWAAQYGFSGAQLGKIGMMGLTGFCFAIIIGGLIADKIGYKFLVFTAIVLHILSAVVTFAAAGKSADVAFNFLYWGTFIFALANGTLEAVANPLVATLFPNNRTHYLNILHASWPAGLALGTVMGWLMDDKLGWHWSIQLATFLIPTVLYAFLFLGQHMPKSEASASGVPFSTMFKDVGILGSLVVCYLLTIFFSQALNLSENVSYAISGVLLILAAVLTKFSWGSILLFVLFITHALVGAVELGTDGWIQNITGNLFDSQKGKFLFFWTSAIMFALRFSTHWLEKNLKISPVMLLLISAILACVGLNLASGISTFTTAILALGLYALGKTFFWPTMLAVASDRFPRSGAIAISIMGGIGMMAGGLLGSSGLGYAKDRFTSETLKAANPELFAASKSDKKSDFLFLEKVEALDGKILEEANKAKEPTAAQKELAAASQTGDRKTLKADSWIPATMAAIFLLLVLYFKSIGGYRPVKIEETK